MSSSVPFVPDDQLRALIAQHVKGRHDLSTRYRKYVSRFAAPSFGSRVAPQCGIINFKIDSKGQSRNPSVEPFVSAAVLLAWVGEYGATIFSDLRRRPGGWVRGPRCTLLEGCPPQTLPCSLVAGEYGL
jgi:hypothetical protein